MPTTLRSSTSLDRRPDLRRNERVIADALDDARTRILLLIERERALITSPPDRSAAAIRWLTATDLAPFRLPHRDFLFLGCDRDGGAVRLAANFPPDVSHLHAREIEALAPAVSLRSLAAQGVMSADELSLLGQAKALIEWHARTRCCGICGAETLVAEGGWKRTCRACTAEWFPRTDPVVIMLVVDGERALLAREPRFPERMWSCLAGFVEPGEDIEHAVARETREEAGLEVGAVTYLSAQPWPFPHSLMIGCLATYLSGTIAVDTAELDAAHWFSRAEIAAMLAGTHPESFWVPGRQAIARTLLEAYVGRSA